MMRRRQATVVASPIAILLILAACASLVGIGAAATPQQPTGALKFLGEWGMRGDSPGELFQPVGLAADVNNRVYIADRRTGFLQKFEATGVPALAFAAPTTLSALAVDSGGAIYVADSRLGRVWIYLPNGELLRNFRIPAQGNTESLFGLCVTEAGVIVVPDARAGRIVAYAPSGKLVRSWNVPRSAAGKPAQPVMTACGGDNFIYVMDRSSERIAKFTTNGEQVASWDAPANANGPLRGIAVSGRHLFALRGNEPFIETWTFEGKRLLAEALGNGVGAESSVYFAVSPDEHVFVLDASRQRVLRFGAEVSAR